MFVVVGCVYLCECGCEICGLRWKWIEVPGEIVDGGIVTVDMRGSGGIRGLPKIPRGRQTRGLHVLVSRVTIKSYI